MSGRRRSKSELESPILDKIEKEDQQTETPEGEEEETGDGPVKKIVKPKPKVVRKRAMKCGMWDKIIKKNPDKKFTFNELIQYIAGGSQILVSWNETGVWIGAEIISVQSRFYRRRRLGTKRTPRKQPLVFTYGYYVKRDNVFSLETEEITIKPFSGKINTQFLGFRFLTTDEKSVLEESIQDLYDYKINEPVHRTRQGSHTEFLVQGQFGSYSKRHLSGIFMIDHIAYNNWNDKPDDYDDYGNNRRRSSGYGSRRRMLESSMVDEVDEIDSKKLWMLSPLVVSFHLPSRTWGFLNFIETTTPVYSDQPWKNLVINPEYKMRMESIVRCTDPTSDRICDFVCNKGLGLNLLFHGPSGCGKTLTAQALSALHKKAVFNISAGDLGSNISQVEHQLSFISNIVARWSIYIQIDECDLFISHRNADNLILNELTCSFLRFLETHATVVFLTTNMHVDGIDPAIRTRIHCFVAFNELTPSERHTVWKNLLKIYSVTDENEIKKFIHEFGSFTLNGREVRNILYLAHALSIDAKRDNISIDDVKCAMEMALLNPPKLDLYV